MIKTHKDLAAPAFDIVLASSSAARKSMLERAGVSFRVMPADIDERSIADLLISEDKRAEHITEQLAIAKAQYISERQVDALVIGSDQTLEFEGEILSKSETIEDAKRALYALSGKTHRLHSSVCVMRGRDILFMHTDSADLTMHRLDQDFIDAYALRDPDALTACVGGYKIEGAGAWLFDEIKGDHYTIMGMPLLPLLAFLRIHCKIMP
ncbi:MAG: Maf family protein [Alphaproteobacteria bacterium]